jgi:hypothetical protein
MEIDYIKKKSTEDLIAQMNVMMHGKGHDAIVNELWRRFKHKKVLAGLKF